MTTFDIQEEFLLNGEPFRIYSGAIHYFRVPKEDWYHSLYNLKALGFNTVETYVPWNLHEAKEGTYDFEGILNLEAFLETAHSLGLYAIVRPSPYICAEWEWGGLPAWLLEKNVRVRSSDAGYIEYVSRYYKELLPRLIPHQLENGGNILMFQVENEYGSYGEEKAYLRAIQALMRENGLTAPFFTSDGPWHATLRAGSMIEDDVLVTGNFGSRAKENFESMQNFFDEHGKKWPLMCMEFWCGWFNRWNEPIVTRETDELVEAVKETMKLGSLNLYMFHGGTNFGFMNGCSARLQHDLHQITSYDYGAPLDEQGNPTEKYFAIQKMIQEHFPELETTEPLIKHSMEVSDIPLVEQVSLFETLDSIAQPVYSTYPLTMEELGQNTGYVLYETVIERDIAEERLRVADGRDRMQLFLNGELQATQYQEEIGEDIPVTLPQHENKLSILMENMGRVNYGHKFTSPTQRKGIRAGVLADLHFITKWNHYSLPFDTTEGIDFSKEWHPNQPGFYRYEFTLDTVADTNLDIAGFGKGFVFVNGINIGRYWEVGPYLSMYVPGAFLNSGTNEIIIFETEGKMSPSIQLRKHALLKNMEESD